LEAAILLRKRNSSLIDLFCVVNVLRLKLITELINFNKMIAEYFVC